MAGRDCGSWSKLRLKCAWTNIGTMDAESELQIPVLRPLVNRDFQHAERWQSWVFNKNKLLMCLSISGREYTLTV